MAEAPLPMAGSIFQHEPIEFQQCELSPVIAVAQAPLKDKELLQIAGQRTVESAFISAPEVLLPADAAVPRERIPK